MVTYKEVEWLHTRRKNGYIQGVKMVGYLSNEVIVGYNEA